MERLGVPMSGPITWQFRFARVMSLQLCFTNALIVHILGPKIEDYSIF